MKKVLKIVLYFFGSIFLVIIIAAIFIKPSTPVKIASSADSTHVGGIAQQKDPVVVSAWTYQQDSDKMTSNKIYYAQVDANALLDLKFPYNGGVTASLVVRYKNGENNVYLTLSKGQFMANAVAPEDIKVRFDTTKALTFSCASSSDGSGNTIFITSANSFIEKLKKSKHLVIQAELYDNGVQEMEFETDNFKWSR